MLKMMQRERNKIDARYEGKDTLPTNEERGKKTKPGNDSKIKNQDLKRRRSDAVIRSMTNCDHKNTDAKK